MAFDAHKNFAISTVATPPSPAASGTSLIIQAGDGTKFPAAPFNVTICPAGALATAANAEIARVTVVSTDTFTITRQQEGTFARTVLAGDQIYNSITAKVLTDIEAKLPQTASSAVTPNGAQTIGTSAVTLVSSNSSRKAFHFWNLDPIALVFGSLGGTAALNQGILLNPNGGNWATPRDTGGVVYTGAISVISTIASTALAFIEI